MHAAHACSKTYFLPLSLIVERYGVAQSLARTYIYTHTNHNMILRLWSALRDNLQVVARLNSTGTAEDEEEDGGWVEICPNCRMANTRQVTTDDVYNNRQWKNCKFFLSFLYSLDKFLNWKGTKKKSFATGLPPHLPALKSPACLSNCVDMRVFVCNNSNTLRSIDFNTILTSIFIS